jgi:hypothetical protein
MFDSGPEYTGIPNLFGKRIMNKIDNQLSIEGFFPEELKAIGSKLMPRWNFVSKIGDGRNVS